MRAGVTPMFRAPLAEAFVKYPFTSIKRSADPLALAKVTLPPTPTGTMTRLGTVLPAAQLTLDAVGFTEPVG